MNELESKSARFVALCMLGMVLFNYPFLARHDPFFETVRSHPRFKQLLDVVHDRWEKFEV